MATLHDLRKVLRAEHRHLWELLAAVRHADAADRAHHLDRMLRYLAVHEAAEQSVLHTSVVNDLTRERVDEEHEVADIVDRLVRTAASTDGAGVHVSPALSDAEPTEFDVVLEQLERTLRAHAAAEEQEELEVLAQLLEPEALGEVHRTLILVREIAEEAASPVSPGSFAAMVRDAHREFSAVSAQVR